VTQTNYQYPSSNGQGEGFRIAFRVPPEMGRLAAVLFESKRWPYMTVSDLYRHAMYNHIVWLDEQDPAEHGLQYLQALITQLTEEECNVQFGRMMHKLKSVIQAHVDEGDLDDASRVVTQVIGAIRGMPAGSMRSRYDREIMESWGEYVGEVVEIVRLVDLDPSKAVEGD